MRKRAQIDKLESIIFLLDGLNILIKNLRPIRNEIAHGGDFDDSCLILIETDSLLGTTDKKEYALIFDELLKKNILQMQLVEKMMIQFLLITYSKILPIRRKIEKDL